MLSGHGRDLSLRSISKTQGILNLICYGIAPAEKTRIYLSHSNPQFPDVREFGSEEVEEKIGAK